MVREVQRGSAATVPIAGIAALIISRLIKAQEIQDNNCDYDNPPGIGTIVVAGAVVQITKKHFHHLTPFYSTTQKRCTEKTGSFHKKIAFPVL